MASNRARRRVSWVGPMLATLVLAVGVTAWAVATLILDGVLIAQSVTVSESPEAIDLGCPESRGGSAWGYSTWSWLPLGKVCHFTRRPDRQPSAFALPGFLALNIAIPAVAVVTVVMVRRRRPDPAIIHRG